MAFIFVFSLLFCNYSASSDEIFPIIGYSCEYLNQADSCYINTVQFPGATRYTWLDSVFNIANNTNIKILLVNAVSPGIPYKHHLTRLSGAYHVIYEAEANFFTHEQGVDVIDSLANNNHAWAVCSSLKKSVFRGFLLDKQKISPGKESSYYVDIYMRSNDNHRYSTLCSVKFYTVVNKDTTNRVSEDIQNSRFGKSAKYQVFRFPCRITVNEKLFIDITYMGSNDSLMIDRIEILDNVADSLEKGYLSHSIQHTALFYNSKVPLLKYYLQDEPKPYQFSSSKQVNAILKDIDSEKSGTQIIADYKNFNNYLDITGSSELFIDFYPFWGNNCAWGERIPEDSGAIFQQQLDYMCNIILKSAHDAIENHPGTQLWYTVQAFGKAINEKNPTRWKNIWYDSIPFEDEYWWREPTPREMRCQIWLALAYGAKGICYWRYHSRIMDFHGKQCWVVGMTDTLGSNIKRPLWHTVAEINRDLSSIGEILLNLESDDVFRVDAVPEGSFIQEVSDSLIQIGTFHDDENRYFIMVNRHCLPNDTISLSFTVKNSYKAKLYDYMTKKNVHPYYEKNDRYIFRTTLEPGAGKLFKLLKK